MRQGIKRNAAWITGIGSLLLFGQALAADLTVSGDLSVTGIADIQGNAWDLGTVSATGSPGLSIGYLDGTGAQIQFGAPNTQTAWLWYAKSGATPKPQMQLDANNVLTLYNASGAPAIVLDPSGATSSASVLTQSAADARYVPAAAIAALTLTGSVEYPGAWAALGLGGGTATGPGSIAGIASTASGTFAAAYGTHAQAQGDFSVALGAGSQAQGRTSLALGSLSIALGDAAIAAGPNSTAASYGSFVVGQYNIDHGDPHNWIPQDPLFTVGNGTDPAHPANALVIKKSGEAIFQGPVHLTPQGDIGMSTFTADPDTLAATSGPRRLSWFNFETPSLAGERGQLPVQSSGVTRSPSSDGQGINLPFAPGTILAYKLIEADGTPNLALDQGTISLLFTPNWTSGAGPWTYSRFVEVQNPGDPGTPTWLLNLDLDGTTLALGIVQGGSITSYYGVPLDLHQGQTYLLTVTYSPTATAIYLNGTQISTNGPGIGAPPAFSSTATVTIGSDHTGDEQVNGQIDDVQFYNYPLTPAQVAGQAALR